MSSQISVDFQEFNVLFTGAVCGQSDHHHPHSFCLSGRVELLQPPYRLPQFDSRTNIQGWWEKCLPIPILLDNKSLTHFSSGEINLGGESERAALSLPSLPPLRGCRCAGWLSFPLSTDTTGLFFFFFFSTYFLVPKRTRGFRPILDLCIHSHKTFCVFNKSGGWTVTSSPPSTWKMCTFTETQEVPAFCLSGDSLTATTGYFLAPCIFSRIVETQPKHEDLLLPRRPHCHGQVQGMGLFPHSPVGFYT